MLFNVLYPMALKYLVYVVPWGIIATIICEIVLDKDNKL